MLAAQAVKCGDAEIVVAGGMESMSNAPYLMKNARGGFRMGNQTIYDAMIHDGLWDAYNDYHMGNTGEVVAERWKVTREDQDAWAFDSHKKAIAAIDAGMFKREIVAGRDPAARRAIPSSSTPTSRPRRETTIEALRALKPAFKKDGTVTAGNAPGVNDGAAAVVVMSKATAKRLGLTPRAEIVAYASSGLAPELVMMAPEKAVRMLWEKTGWTADDVDLYEFNEAFSVQQVALAARARVEPGEAQRARRRGRARPSDRRLRRAHPDDAAPRARGPRRIEGDRRALPRRRKRRRHGDPAMKSENRSASSARDRWATGSRTSRRRPASRVVMRDLTDAFVGKGLDTIAKNLQRGVDKGKMTAAEKDAVLGQDQGHHEARGSGRLRRRRRGGGREARRQARAVQDARRPGEARRDPGHEHVVAPGHEDRRGDRSAPIGSSACTS